MHDEEFPKIPFLDPKFQTSVYNKVLTQWNESVALFFCYPRANFAMAGVIEMWVMHEYHETCYKINK